MIRTIKIFCVASIVLFVACKSSIPDGWNAHRLTFLFSGESFEFALPSNFSRTRVQNTDPAQQQFKFKDDKTNEEIICSIAKVGEAYDLDRARITFQSSKKSSLTDPLSELFEGEDLKINGGTFLVHGSQMKDPGNLSQDSLQANWYTMGTVGNMGIFIGSIKKVSAGKNLEKEFNKQKELVTKITKETVKSLQK